jgi:hypothetical protein
LIIIAPCYAQWRRFEKAAILTQVMTFLFNQPLENRNSETELPVQGF